MIKKIIKRSNLEEAFSHIKLRKSLKRSELPADDIKDIILELGDVSQYFTTTQLNKTVYKLLLKRSQLVAANYNLKSAVFNLGPTGYPFEILCAELFKVKGYKTRVSVMRRGKKVKHEIDVEALRDDGNIYSECKYHVNRNHINNIKVPLYINSRSLDIAQANPTLSFTYAIISNTKFSKDAINYCLGEGLLLFAMNYPRENTLIDIMKNYKVYPVTVLHSLRKKEKDHLLKLKVVVVKQLKKSILTQIGLQEDRIKKVLQEVYILTRPN